MGKQTTQAADTDVLCADDALQVVENILQPQAEQDEQENQDNDPSTVTRDGVQVFPIDVCFSDTIIDYIKNVADVANSSVSSVALSCLSAYSVAMCGKRWAVLRGDDGNVRYHVDPNIYTCFVARAGQGKTQTLSMPTKPLNDADDLLSDTYINECKISKQNGTEPPKLKQHVIHDATPEFTIKQLRDNCDDLGNPTIGCMIWNDELSGFISQAKGYKGVNYFTLLCKAYDGLSYSNGRLSTGVGRLKKMNLSLSFAIQTQRLKKCVTDEMLENGFLQRIMWVFDDTETKYKSRNGQDPTLKLYWDNAINDIEHEQPKQLEYTEDARQLFWKWCDNCTDFLAEQDDPVLTEFVNKHSYFVLRLSLIFATMRKQDEITTENVTAAIKCCNYFLYTDTLLLGYLQYGENVGENTATNLVYKFLKKIVAPGQEISETALSKLIGRAPNYITKTRQRYEQQHGIKGTNESNVK